MPDAVIGHSFGEFAAAVAAGAMTWHEGLALVAQRAALMAKLPATGAMLVAFEKQAAMKSLIQEGALDVAVAAVNAPSVTVLSGEAKEIVRAEAMLEKKSVQAKRLAVVHAFHSKHMSPMVEQFAQAIDATLGHGTPPTDDRNYPQLISTVHGRVAQIDELRTVEYWKRHTEQTVLFMEAMEAVKQDGRCTSHRPMCICLRSALNGWMVWLQVRQHHRDRTGSSSWSGKTLLAWPRHSRCACSIAKTPCSNCYGHSLHSSGQCRAHLSMGRFPLAGMAQSERR